MGDLKEEIREHLLALRRQVHFGVELNTINAQSLIGQRRHNIIRGNGCYRESLAYTVNAITMCQ